MSNKRINLTKFKGLTKGEWVYEEVVKGTGWVATLMIPHTGADTPEHPHGLPYPVASVTEHDYHLTRSDIKAMASVPDLIAELKKCYAREDELLDALQVIKEDLETGIAQGNIPINATTGIDLTKIRNFANDASQ
jgi:hypothetical protein